MKRAALVAIALALAGCGSDEDVGESGGCAGGLVVNGEFYLAMPLEAPRPKAGGPVAGGLEPGCNDGGPIEPDVETGVRAVSGVPPEVAVYHESGTSTIYLNTGFFAELPDHPLHDRLYGSPDRPRNRVRGRACRLDAEVSSTGNLVVRDGERPVVVGVDARTRITGFDRGGLPYLERGDRLRIHGFGCARDVMQARRIEPQP